MPTTMPHSLPKAAPAHVGFISVESYGFKSSKGRRTIRGVINEMTRRPSAIPHVSAPIAEIPLFCPFGPPSSAIPLIRQKIAEFNKQSPQRMRKDAQLLVAGVASYPVKCEELLENPYEWGQFGKFCALVKGFLCGEFGERVHTCVAHLDEGYAHVHFLLLPYNVPENGGKLGIGRNHPGKFADDRTGDRREKYKAAMKAFLDRFHDAVGKIMGWARISSQPRQRNPNRAQYLWFRDLWSALTKTDRPKKKDEPAAVEAPRVHHNPAAQAFAQVEPELPCGMPSEDAFAATLKWKRKENEMLLKCDEIFQDTQKSTISPMRARF